MRSETAGRRIARSAGEVVGSIANRLRIARKDRAEAVVRAAGPSVAERREALRTFYEAFEGLVETLCDSATYGPTPKLERQYATQRAWTVANYPDLRPFVVSFLRYEPEDADLGRRLVGEPVDAFEALAVADDLEGFLATDDGNTISRITRTREALHLYGEHLRQLAARA